MKSGGVPAAVVVGLLFLLSSCTPPNQVATNSPDVSPSPSAAASPTPTVEPTPSATPSTGPSPSPTKLIIRTLPFHLGEVGVTYGTVTLVAAGGVKPYKWSIASGALPPGVALGSTGKATGKPTTVGTYSFGVRVDDAAGSAAGAPSSILVFRQLAFVGPTAVCGNSPSSCDLKISYTGGIPGGKVSVKVVKATGATLYKTTDACATSTATATTSPPPGSKISASGGFMTLAAGPSDRTTWCQYTGTLEFVLIAQSPCGSGLLCVSSNRLSVRFSI